MRDSTHRLRIEEKRLFRRFIYTIIFILVLIGFAFYAGPPFLAKVILTFSSIKPEDKNAAKNDINTSILFPPSLNPYFEATNSAKITVSGVGEKDATVVVYVNDEEIADVETDKDGKFSAKNIPLKVGDNAIQAKILKDRLESSLSALMKVTYIKDAPKLDISSPKDGDKFYSDEKDIRIQGTTDPDNRVNVNDRMAIVGMDGKFNFSVHLSDGENKFTVKAVNPAGNTTQSEIKVTYNP